MFRQYFLNAFCLSLMCFLFSFCSKSDTAPNSLPAIAALNADWQTLTPKAIVANEAYEGELYMPYFGGNGASYSEGESIASTGVTGLSAKLKAGELKNGLGHLSFAINGTPSAAGNATFTLSFGGQTQTIVLPIQETADVATPFFWGFFDDAGTPTSFYEGLGTKPSTHMMFDGWYADGDRTFPTSFCQQADANGFTPFVTLEPFMGMDEILSGKYDADLTAYANAIKAFGKPILFRFAHEFNGDWYPWSVMNDQVVPAATYVKGFKYVHDKLTQAGATNLVWIWAPNNENGGKNPQTLDTYYPGDAFVDIIGMDGYNFGTSQDWSKWASFSQTFGNLYNWIETNHPNKPILIAEMGCSSQGGDKVAWINDMFVQLEQNFPKIMSIVWFNIDKETDWRLHENDATKQAFMNGVSAPRVQYDRSFGGIVK